MSITLSKKHGVNPGLINCYFCGEPKEIALYGRLPGGKEAPRSGVLDLEPCETCRDLMSRGILLISTRDGEAEKCDAARDEARRAGAPFIPNPWRSGGWVVVSEEAIRRVLPPEQAEALLQQRWGFVEDSNWNRLGLPRAPSAEAGGD